MESVSSRKPLSPEAIAALLRPLADFPRLALAVSGGADSMALMRFARIWLNQLQHHGSSDRPLPAIIVVTVNHGLRPEAADEAEFVARAAAETGFEHVTLVWTGDKPKTGVQEAARTARYNLMAEFARSRGCGAIVTAHHLDDQAETLLMRLARGSGPDGLASMSPRSIWGDHLSSGVAILRPLLDIPKSRLVASLDAMGAGWVEDPSNSNKRYERASIRYSLKTSAALPLTSSALGLSARRLGRAREALETYAEQFILKAVRVHPAGFGEISLADLLEAPEDIAMRALTRMASTFGSRSTPPRLAKVEAAYLRLAGQAPSGFTLGGCAFTLSRGRLRACRETGRLHDPLLMLEPGRTALWDQRFLVTAPETAPSPLIVRALGSDGVRSARKLHPPSQTVPLMAAETSPGFWLPEFPVSGGCASDVTSASDVTCANGVLAAMTLAAAPALGAFAPAPSPFGSVSREWASQCRAEFILPTITSLRAVSSF